MKKLFFFAAAMCAALTMNATVYDFSNLAKESDWTVSNATKNTTESKETKLVYDISKDVEATITPGTYTNIVFAIKNTSDKQKAFNIGIETGKSYFEFGGKNGIIRLSNVKVGDYITLHVASKGSTGANFSGDNYPVGASAVSTELTLPAKGKDGDAGADKQGYIWKDIVYLATSASVEIKEFAAGYRITSITIGPASAIDEVAAPVSIQKVMENGEMFIIKNGVKYNALGARVF